MNDFRFGDIVLLNFPFSDNASVKRRPALIIRDTKDGDIVVCRITSQIYDTNFDVKINEWESCGLLLPSVIRTHKIATLSKKLIEFKIGSINNSTTIEVKEKFSEITK